MTAPLPDPHAPGPWRHNPDREVIVDANGNFVIYTTGVTSSNIGKITAASEMVDALISMIAAADAVQRNWTTGTMFGIDALNDAAAEARAILAKIDGGAP